MTEQEAIEFYLNRMSLKIWQRLLVFRHVVCYWMLVYEFIIMGCK